MPDHMPSPSDVNAHLHEPILYSGAPPDHSDGPIDVGDGHDGHHQPAMSPPRLRGLPMLFLSRGAQVYAGGAPFTDETTVGELVNREEVRAAERRAAQRHEPLPDTFVFFNEARTEVKVLLWSNRGFTVLHQRLDEGTFGSPRHVAPGEKIAVEELGELLCGPARLTPVSPAARPVEAPPPSVH
jgi:hypothetical protein